MLAAAAALAGVVALRGSDPSMPTAGRGLPATVVRVIDGDTVVVRIGSSERTVRVIGIDTPERGACGYERASARMRALALRRGAGRAAGRAVRLAPDPTQDRLDRFGRTLAYLDRESDDLDIGRALVAEGWAEVFVFGGNPFRRHPGYARAERHARDEGRGVWGRCGR